MFFFFLLPFEYETYPGPETRVFRDCGLFGLGETWPLSRVTLGDFRAGRKERKREKRGKKKKKNARRHPLETKFFRKRISLFGSELCPLSQVFTIRAWGSIEWWNWRGSRHHRRGTIRFFQNQRDQGFCAFEKVSTTLRLIASIKNESNVTIGRDRIVNINESAYSLVIKGGEGKREGGGRGD